MGETYPVNWLETYDSHKRFATHDLNAWLCEQLSPQPSEVLLDIGCGNGEQVMYFAGLCGTSIGLDNAEIPMEKLIAEVRSRGIKNVVCLRCPGERIELRDGTVDMVLCNFALPYMNAEAVLSEIRRVLTPRGRAIVTGYGQGNISELLDMHRANCPRVPAGYLDGFCDPLRFAETAQGLFHRVKTLRWLNPLVFPTVADFMRYYLWTELYLAANDANGTLREQMIRTATKILGRAGSIRITKVISALCLSD